MPLGMVPARGLGGWLWWSRASDRPTSPTSCGT